MKLRKSKNKKLIKLASNFQPWDFGYNLDIEQEMFKRMYQYFSGTEPICSDSKRVMREVNLAIRLLEIIQERDKSIELLSDNTWISTKYVNIRNSKRFTHLINLENPVMKDDLRTRKAWYLYNKLRYYNMKSWWE